MDTSMKRNKTMRAGMAVAIAAMISTCAISGVLAKYVSTDNATDTARVAKFGVVTSASGDLFGQSYAQLADGNGVQAWAVNSPTVAVNATDQANGVNVVAPGTKNENGLTFKVKGTPEVSTKLTLDAPEGTITGANGNDDKDFVNTDIFLKSGAYSVMAAVNSSDVAITTDNMTDFYSYDGTNKTFAPLAAVPAASTTVYKQVQLTGVSGNAASSMSGDYYPIEWSVNGTALSGDNNKVAGLKTAVETALSNSNLTHAPNVPWNGTAGDGLAKITWQWTFVDAWQDVATDTVLPNWENTTLKDLEDTALGQMITLARDNANTDYKMAVLDGSSWTEVAYAEIDADSNSANKAIVAYKNGASAQAPTKWSDANVACLTVTFGERVTVEQVD